MDCISLSGKICYYALTWKRAWKDNADNIKGADNADNIKGVFQAGLFSGMTGRIITNREGSRYTDMLAYFKDGKHGGEWC